MKKVGYIRTIRDKKAYRQQNELVRRYLCDEYIIEKEETQFDDEKSELNKVLKKMKKGDKLVIGTLHALGMTIRHLFVFMNMLEERGINLRIQDIGIDTSTAKYNPLFQYVRYIQKSDELIEKDKHRIVNSRIDIDAGAYGISNEQIQEIINLRKEGLTLKEIVSLTGLGLNTVHRFAKWSKVGVDKRQIPEETVKKIVELKREGVTHKKISEITGVSTKTVGKYAKLYTKKKRKRDMES